MTIISFAGCKTNEEKATELIKVEFSKTLYDYPSYDPIETVVNEAKWTAYNDSAIWNRGVDAYQAYDKAQDNMIKAKYAEDWQKGYSQVAALYLTIFKKKADEINKISKTLDDQKVIGWEITHKFRCKNKGGVYDILQYRFVANKDLTQILITEDLGDTNMQMARIYIKDIMKGKFGTVEDIMKSIQKP